MWLWTLFFPDWSADPVNFVISDLSNSPIHIQPEWYFLHLYAILRSIPNKLGGLLGFILALILLALLAGVKNKVSLSQFNFYRILRWLFIAANIILIWLGMQPVEDPYIFIGQLRAILYFIYIFVCLMFDILLKELFF